MHFDPHFSPSLYSLGTLLVSAACFTLFVLPSDYDENLAPEEADGGPQLGMLDALKVPSIALAAYSILCASSSIGFLLTSLEPHMRQFNLTPLVMGKSTNNCSFGFKGMVIDGSKGRKVRTFRK